MRLGKRQKQILQYLYESDLRKPSGWNSYGYVQYVIYPGYDVKWDHPNCDRTPPGDAASMSRAVKKLLEQRLIERISEREYKSKVNNRTALNPGINWHLRITEEGIEKVDSWK